MRDSCNEGNLKRTLEVPSDRTRILRTRRPDRTPASLTTAAPPIRGGCCHIRRGHNRAVGMKKTLGVTAPAIAVLGGVGAIGAGAVTWLISSIEQPDFSGLTAMAEFTPEPVETAATPAVAGDDAWLVATAEATGIPRRALS